LQKDLKIICWRGFVPPFYAAPLAAELDAVAFTAAFDSDWRHQSLAGFGTVTGVDVNMLAPQAGWAVVGETVTSDVRTAVLTFEILYSSLEFGSLHGQSLLSSK
jgi:hypothetical protein